MSQASDSVIEEYINKTIQHLTEIVKCCTCLVFKLVEVHLESIVPILGEHVLPEFHSASFFGRARISVRVSARWEVFATAIVPGFVEVGLVSAIMGVEYVSGTREPARIASGSE